MSNTKIRVDFKSVTLCIALALAACSVRAAENVCYEVAPATRDHAVCKALAANMNNFCDQKPMVCALKISDAQQAILLPGWKEIPIKKNKSLLEHLVKGSAVQSSTHIESIANRAWRDVENHIDKYGSNGRSRLYKASIDVFNQAKHLEVYKLDTGYCEAVNFGKARNEPPWKDTFARMALTQSKKQYVQVDTFFLPRQFADVEFDGSNRESFAGAKNLPVNSEAFIFAGKTYFLTFSVSNPIVWTYGTLKATGADSIDANIPAQVCVLNYIGSN